MFQFSYLFNLLDDALQSFIYMRRWVFTWADQMFWFSHLFNLLMSSLYKGKDYIFSIIWKTKKQNEWNSECSSYMTTCLPHLESSISVTIYTGSGSLFGSIWNFGFLISVCVSESTLSSLSDDHLLNKLPAAMPKVPKVKCFQLCWGLFCPDLTKPWCFPRSSSRLHCWVSTIFQSIPTPEEWYCWPQVNKEMVKYLISDHIWQVIGWWAS